MDAVAVAATFSTGTLNNFMKNVGIVAFSTTRTAFGGGLVLGHVVPDGCSAFRHTVATVVAPFPDYC